MKNEWIIHIWGKDREHLELTNQEKFHMSMIKNCDHSIFDKVLINIAMDNIYNKKLFKLLKNAGSGLIFKQLRNKNIVLNGSKSKGNEIKKKN